MPRRIPQDPVIRNLAARIQSAQLNRRQLFRGMAVGGAALGTSALAACSSSGSQEGTVRWANWTYYLDYDEGTGDFPTLEAFMEASGIDVRYIEDIDDNNTFIAKIRDQLELGQDTGYDLYTLTDSSLVRLFEKDQMKAFDHSLMPNVGEQMIDIVNQSSWDPNREYSIPWQSGMTGLVYNTQLYPNGIESVSDLWNPELAGRVSLLSEQGDTVGLMMLDQGVDITGDWGDDEFYAALDVIDEQLQSGQVATVKGNSYTQDLEAGDVWAGMAWSGDISILNHDAGEEIWKFVVPDAGAAMFIDSFAMPPSTEADAEIHELINYYYEPEVAAEVAAYVEYVTPVAGAREAMEAIDPELAENTLLFPDDEMSAKIFDMRALTAQEDNTYRQAFQQVLGN